MGRGRSIRGDDGAWEQGNLREGIRERRQGGVQEGMRVHGGST